MFNLTWPLIKSYVFSDNLHRNCTTYYLHVILTVKSRPCMEFSDWNVASREKSSTIQLHSSIEREHVFHLRMFVSLLRTRVNDFSPWYQIPYQVSLTVHSKEHLPISLSICQHLSGWSFTSEMFVNLLFAVLRKKWVGFNDRISISSTMKICLVEYC